MNYGTDIARVSTHETVSVAAGYELCYRPLCEVGRGFVFPCDVQGRVALDELSERARSNYLYARAVVGRDFGWPLVQHRS